MNQEELDKHFLNVQLDKFTMNAYVPRKAILKAVQENLQVFSGYLLDVGCGVMPYRQLICSGNPKVEKYIGLDLATSSIHDTSIADLFWDGKTIPLTDEAVSSAMATEVLEHSFEPEETLKEINRVLKPGGIFFFTVPFLWPLHEVPYDAYRYTPFSLKRLLDKSGFTDVSIHSLGGWHASFAQMIGLWVSESGLEGRRKKWAVKVAKKIIPYLLKKDIADRNFGNHSMSTGFYGLAKKRETA